MRKYALLLVLLLALPMAGCEKDTRAKRQSSLNKIKAEQAREEFKAAPTQERKVEIADEYFRTAPEQIGVVDDYLQKKKNTTPKPEAFEKQNSERP